MIERNAVAQARLIEDLLDMNRIFSRKMRLDLQPTDLPRVVEAAVDAVRPSANGKKLRLQLVLDPAAEPLSGDPNRLQQVVWNLPTSAVKFTPAGGLIDVRMRCTDGQLDLNITDSGAGIAPGFLPHVFDRFRQADSSITRGHGGPGLGLPIVKQHTPAGLVAGDRRRPAGADPARRRRRTRRTRADSPTARRQPRRRLHRRLGRCSTGHAGARAA